MTQTPHTHTFLVLFGVLLMVFCGTSCSVALSFGECSNASDCPANHVCTADGLCRSLVSPECNDLSGAVDDPNAIWLGAVFPLSGENEESGRHPLNAVKMAVDEINLQGGVGGLQNRPIALLACDDQGDVGRAIASARHLDNVLEVPAIVGSAFSSETLGLAQGYTIDAGILLISPASTAVEIGELDDDDLVWRTAPSDNFQSEAIAHFALWQLLERQGAADPVNIVTVHADDVYGRGLSGEFKSRLSSSANVLPEVPDHVFVDVPYTSDDPASVEQAKSELLGSDPDIVVVVGFEESADIIGLTKTEPSLRTVPFFATDGVRTDRLRILFSGDDKPDLLFGVIPGGRQGVAYDAFAAAFEDRYGTGNPPAWTEHAYDAAYLLTFAMAGVDGEPTGAAMADALKRVSTAGGSAVKVGKADLISACDVMGRGAPLDVTGASGALSFDGRTGEVQSTDLVRWDIDTGSQEYVDCGIATHYISPEQPERFWCSALCLQGTEDMCRPANAPP